MPLKPFSRAASSRNRAKARSFSTMSSTGSPRVRCVAVVADLVHQHGRRRAAPIPERIAVRTRRPVRDGSSPRAVRVRRRRPRRSPRHRTERCGPQTGALARDARRRIDLRQVQRERAALARRADQPDLAAQQARQLAADRQAEARAAVLAAGAAVGLLERLEDDLLLVRRDADAGIRAPRTRSRRRRD